jgi:membrane protein
LAVDTTPKQNLFKRIQASAEQKVDELTERCFVVALTLGTFKKFSADDASHMAAGLAYYGFLSLFPLILGIIALLSLFLESETSQADVIGFAADFLPGSGGLVSQNIESVMRHRGSLGVIAVVGLIWSGSAIFAAVNKSLNKAWNIDTSLPFLKAKAKHLGMAVGVGALFGLSVGVAVVAQFIDRIIVSDTGAISLASVVGRVTFQLVALAFTFGMFAAVYKLMPDTKTEFRYIWPGAVVASVLFELIKSLFVFYVDRFTSFGSVYGTIAPIIVLLLWVYFCGMILLLGAELSSEYKRLRIERG